MWAFERKTFKRGRSAVPATLFRTRACLRCLSKFFDIFLGDSTISAKLTTAERNLLSPFRARPDAFIEGVKHFDECIDMLRGIEKLGGKFSLRHKPLVQIINLLMFYRYPSNKTRVPD